MPKPIWSSIVNMMICGLLAFSAHFQWSAADRLARHDEKFMYTEKRLDRLEGVVWKAE